MLFQRCDLKEGDTVADIGAGTGILTEQLLKRGLSVTAVEPNEDMLREASANLGEIPFFQAVKAPAESTGLPMHSFPPAAEICRPPAFFWYFSFKKST